MLDILHRLIGSLSLNAYRVDIYMYININIYIYIYQVVQDLGYQEYSFSSS